MVVIYRVCSRNMDIRVLKEMISQVASFSDTLNHNLAPILSTIKSFAVIARIDNCYKFYWGYMINI